MSSTGTGGTTPNGNGQGAGGASGGATPQGSGPFTHAVPEGHAKKMSEVLGEVVWLMSQSPTHKQFFISDLEWFVMTPILLQQFRLYYAQDKPLGVVLWGQVSEEVAARLVEGPPKLRPQDWKSGPQIWAIEVIAPFGGAEEMVKDFKTKLYPNEPVSFVAVTPQGGKEVRVL